MCFLVADTETTGLPLYGKPTTDPGQPRIVQLGAILYDARYRVMGELNYLVKPDGWTIPKDASDVHGITTEMCEQYGLGLPTVINSYIALAKRAKLLVFHNQDFDGRMLRREMHAIGQSAQAEEFRARPFLCTMKHSVEIVKAPNKNGRAGYKWPTLQELHTFLFGHGFEGGHDAMEDTRATGRCFIALHPLPDLPPKQLSLDAAPPPKPLDAPPTDGPVEPEKKTAAEWANESELRKATNPEPAAAVAAPAESMEDFA